MHSTYGLHSNLGWFDVIYPEIFIVGVFKLFATEAPEVRGEAGKENPFPRRVFQEPLVYDIIRDRPNMPTPIALLRLPIQFFVVLNNRLAILRSGPASAGYIRGLRPRPIPQFAHEHSVMVRLPAVPKTAAF